MELTDEQLALVEEYAAAFLTFREIAVLIGVNVYQFCELMNDKDSPAFYRYFVGKTRAKFEIRKNIVDMAKKGSPQAEELTLSLMNDAEFEELDI
ncbi:MAG TPA: hypothetical protein PKH94_11390 [Bacteroidales bacterium]|nr:hypothetical protein [Bacteroidales bacterium]